MNNNFINQLTKSTSLTIKTKKSLIKIFSNTKSIELYLNKEYIKIAEDVRNFFVSSRLYFGEICDSSIDFPALSEFINNFLSKNDHKMMLLYNLPHISILMARQNSEAKDILDEKQLELISINRDLIIGYFLISKKKIRDDCYHILEYYGMQMLDYDILSYMINRYEIIGTLDQKKLIEILPGKIDKYMVPFWKQFFEKREIANKYDDLVKYVDLRDIKNIVDWREMKCAWIDDNI